MAAVALCAVSFPVTAQSVFSIPQDGDFASANLRWSGAYANGYDANIALKNYDGRLVLCGVGVVTNIQLNQAVKTALRGGTIKINGRTVLKDFSFFAKASNAASLRGTHANCKSTGVAVPSSSDKLSMSYGKGTFRN
jgi:hypothetical protein